MSSIDRDRIANLEAERARLGQARAEVERDITAGVAMNEAAGRSAAEDAAANERIRADMAESGARSASASARAAHADAREDREVAGNASFVASIAVLVALALVCVIGYFAWWQPNHTIDVQTNTVIDRTTRTVQVPASQPPAPPQVNVNVQSPPATQPSHRADDDENLDKQGTGTRDSDKSSETDSYGPGSGG